jgi:hypothetical protein
VTELKATYPMHSTVLEKLQLIKDNPGFYKGLTDEEQAEIFLFLLQPKKLFQKPTTIKAVDGKDGVTPIKDVDYLSKESSLQFLTDIQKQVEKRLESITDGVDGKDAVITPELIEDIVLQVTSSIDFPKQILFDPTYLEESIEDLALDHEQLRDEVKTLKEASRTIVGGGATIGWVMSYVDTALAGVDSTNTWSFYSTSWSVEPALVETIGAGDVYSYTLDGTTRYRLVPDPYDPTQDAFYTTFSGSVLAGLIVTRG